MIMPWTATVSYNNGSPSKAKKMLMNVLY